ncbi:hypothetical protein UA70_21020 [Raoultella planticola]|nr:hypothetical protein UA70_21020 [Raoultella planticola]
MVKHLFPVLADVFPHFNFECGKPRIQTKNGAFFLCNRIYPAAARPHPASAGIGGAGLYKVRRTRRQRQVLVIMNFFCKRSQDRLRGPH